MSATSLIIGRMTRNLHRDSGYERMQMRSAMYFAKSKPAEKASSINRSLIRYTKPTYKGR